MMTIQPRLEFTNKPGIQTITMKTMMPMIESFQRAKIMVGETTVCQRSPKMSK